MENYTVQINGVELNVEGTWTGMNLPATRENPEERKEFEIFKVTTVDSFICIYDLLSDEQLKEIYEQIE